MFRSSPILRRSSVFLLAFVLFLALALAFSPLTNALFLALGALLAGALFLFPELGVYLLVFAVPFGSLMPLNLGSANLTAADALLLLAWTLYLARGIARRKIELHFPSLALPFMLFVLAAGISITVAPSLPDSIAELTKWIEMFAAYWLVANFFEVKNVRRLLAVMFCAGIAEAFLGAYQYYFRVGPEGFLLFGGANLRAYGTFEQPNPYAGYLGLILPLALGTGLIILFETAKSKMNFAHSEFILLGLAVISFSAMLGGLFFSYSRGAWIASAAGLSVTLLLILVRSKRAVSLSVLLALVLAIVIGLGEINIVPNIITERFASVGDYFNFQDVRGVRANDENFALVERRAHWQAALSMFESSPWVGVGFGNYAVAYPNFSLPKWEDPLGHAHNYYLNVLAEAGGIGFIAFLVLWIAIFWVLFRAALRGEHALARGVIAGACGVIVALSIHNFFDNLFVHAMYIQVGLTLGIVERLKVERRFSTT